MKKKLFYSVIFIVIGSVFVSIVSNLIQNREKEHLLGEQVLVSVSYNTIVEAFRIHSSILYLNKIDTPEVKSLLSQVYGATPKEQDIIRKKLHNLLLAMYNSNLTEFKLKQLHFHLKNNESFLRFHRPNKYGDNLTGIRATVEYVNKYHKPITGFEEGRIFNGYRFVYPLSYKGEFLGSVEISVSMDTIINEFRKEMPKDIDFIIKKSTVESKVFDNEKNNYVQCPTTKGYYHEKTISNGSNSLIEEILHKYIESYDIESQLAKGEIFNFVSQYNRNYYVITFLPIKNAVFNETVAYITVVKEHNAFFHYNQHYIFFLVVLLVLTAIIIYVVYHLDTAKGILERKDKVIKEAQKIGHLGFWEFNAIENELVWSDEVYRIFGLDKKKFKVSYDSFLEHVHPHDREKVIKAYQDSVKNKTSYQIEHRIVTQKNEIKYVEEKCHHTFNSEGEVVQSLGTVHDITNLKIYQIKIEKIKDQFESLVSHIPTIVYRREIDENFTILYVNDAVKKITNYRPNELKSNKVLSFSSIIVPEDYKKIKKAVFNCIKEDRKNIKLEYRIITKDGNIIWVEDSIEIITKNNHQYIEGMINDITLQKEAYDKLYKFIDTQDNIVILTDGQEIDFANKKFFDFLGFKNLKDFKFQHKCICEKFIDSEKFFSLAQVKDDELWIDIIKVLPHSQRVVAIMGQDFIVHAFSVTINQFEENLQIISFTDISQTMLINIELEEKTIHDKLTNAYNREYFEQNYQKMIQKFEQFNSHFALAILDIDHFKSVNDTFGHDVGDYVLKELVTKIKSVSRVDDTLIRWGGEEFVIILKVDSFYSLEKALEHFRVVIEKHYFEHVERLTCSIGATIYEENESIETTIKRADNALYDAKRNGRNQVVIL